MKKLLISTILVGSLMLGISALSMGDDKDKKYAPKREWKIQAPEKRPLPWASRIEVKAPPASIRRDTLQENRTRDLPTPRKYPSGGPSMIGVDRAVPIS